MDKSPAGIPESGTPAHIKSFKDIPGTTVFDSTQCRMGYSLNMCCVSLTKSENRDEFRKNERSYLETFPLSEEQIEAVLARDYNTMIRLGGNIYYLGKLGAVDGHSFQKLASMMTGIPEPELRKIMVSGGRSVHDITRDEQGKNHG